MKTKAAIIQSNYIPWKGYFDSINMVDVMVIYDDMQYTRRDWRNRNIIKTAQGNKWLSVPVEVSGKFHQKINETLVADQVWKKSHLDILRLNYKQAPCFKEVWPWVEELYRSCDSLNLSRINQHFIQAVNSYLGITTRIVRSEEFELAEERNQRLINICKDLGAEKYFSGPSAKAYMDLDLFEKNGIGVEFFEYSGYPEYNQMFPPFDHCVSILDLLFNTGPDAPYYIWGWREGSTKQ